MSDTTLRFIHELTYDGLPAEVVRQARRCLIDLTGVAAAGRATEVSRIAGDHAARHLAAGAGHAARILLDGRPASPVGAAFAGATTVDSYDAHDGHPLAKGHVGAAVVPALLAVADSERGVDAREMVTATVVGYEVATRAGVELHGTATDYHTSGAWNALGCAAVAARLLGLDAPTTRHALGIAEYHGPRSQMMRCIDHPTMVKDGSGVGAMVGVQAAYLAADGFTGAPAATLEGEAVGDHWADLGRRWAIGEQYFKPHPICRWAQPAVDAALALKHEHGIDPGAVMRVRVSTFHEAARLTQRAPASTEEAQYSLPYALAAALVRGRLGIDEVAGSALGDPVVLRLAEAVELQEDAACDAAFPRERWARVDVEMADGRRFASPPTTTRGDPWSPLSDAEMSAKYRELAGPLLGPEMAADLETRLWRLGAGPDDGRAVLDVLLSAPRQAAARAAGG